MIRGHLEYGATASHAPRASQSLERSSAQHSTLRLRLLDVRVLDGLTPSPHPLHPRVALPDREHEIGNVESQVPVVRYSRKSHLVNRSFFPERNVTMSALTQATIIVEAGETSGTLTQARAAIHQGRKLFILDSCFLDPAITWPAKFAEKGAIRVRNYDDIREHLDLQASTD